ncbi:hypothetical protein [Hymenobacter terrenus]|uniref:hypothetical protein n=1 Tax=Hymenobacter terrenus TaxID=1629124 RepID=UPI0006968280|nr:hypothetical protein [Hymenobacter terrenus]
MNADDRLNQLEPLLCEALTVLDRHTYQLKQLNGAVGRLTTAVAQQGDNICFLLSEQAEIKTDVASLKVDVADIKTDVTGLKVDVASLKVDMADMKTDVSSLKSQLIGLEDGQAGMNSKLDLILQTLQRPSQ